MEALAFVARALGAGWQKFSSKRSRDDLRLKFVWVVVNPSIDYRIGGDTRTSNAIAARQICDLHAFFASTFKQ